jgi:hypothetical protein
MSRRLRVAMADWRTGTTVAVAAARMRVTQADLLAALAAEFAQRDEPVWTDEQILATFGVMVP